MIDTPLTSSSSLHQMADVLRPSMDVLQMSDSCLYQSDSNPSTNHQSAAQPISVNRPVIPPISTVPESERPQSRDRCNTWPRRQPDDDTHELTESSTLLNEEIKEEDEDLDLFCDSNGLRVPQASGTDTPSPSNSDSSVNSSANNLNGASADGAAKNRGLPSRRNAWGNMSYADLITQAIMSAPEQRMTLAQIYDWMVAQVAFFRDRGDNSSSAGWKNSIRHNLSLHSRFMRIQNEGAGKSSWWVLNPDAKPGKSSRRRAATVETSNKTLERKRGRVKKKVEQMRAMGLTGSQVLSPGSTGEDNGDQFNAFRGRSDSTLSNYSTPASRLSPSAEHAAAVPHTSGYSNYWPVTDQLPPSAHVSGELLDLTGSMRLSNMKQTTNCYGTGPAQRTCLYNNGGADSSSPIKSEPVLPPVKLEPMNFCQTRAGSDQLPTYQELYPPSNNNGRIQNPMLREALQHQFNLNNQQQQQPVQQGAQHPSSLNFVGGCGVAPLNGLPNDLSYDSWQPMDVQCDIDQVLRHEMHVAGKVDFGNFDNL